MSLGDNAYSRIPRFRIWKYGIPGFRQKNCRIPPSPLFYFKSSIIPDFQYFARNLGVWVSGNTRCHPLSIFKLSDTISFSIIIYIPSLPIRINLSLPWQSRPFFLTTSYRVLSPCVRKNYLKMLFITARQRHPHPPHITSYHIAIHHTALILLHCT